VLRILFLRFLKAIGGSKKTPGPLFLYRKGFPNILNFYQNFFRLENFILIDLCLCTKRRSHFVVLSLSTKYSPKKLFCHWPYGHKELMRWMIGLLFLSIGTSCATIGARLDIETFREQVKVSEGADIFYLAEYKEDKNKKCFPDGSDRSCGDSNNIFGYKFTAAGEPLDVKAFSLNHSGGKISREDLIEFSHFVAAEVALQQGYKYFLFEEMSPNVFCLDSDAVEHRGSFIGNTYYGNTYTSTSTSCSSVLSANILVFNKTEDIRNGLAYKNKFRESTHASVRDLYRKGYSSAELDVFKKSKYTILELYRPLEAWKTYFSASSVFTDLKAKYGLQKRWSYEIKPSSPPEKTVIEKNKLDMSKSATE
jgi:hypothetical protein